MSNESPERTSQEGVLLGSNVAYQYDNSWYLGILVKCRGRVTVTIESGCLSLLTRRVAPGKERHNIPSGEHLVTHDDGDTERVNPKVAKEGADNFKDFVSITCAFGLCELMFAQCAVCLFYNNFQFRFFCRNLIRR